MEDVRIRPSAELEQQQIEEVVAAKVPSLEGWVVKRLSESAPTEAADSKEFIQEIVKHIKSRPSAPGE